MSCLRPCHWRLADAATNWHRLAVLRDTTQLEAGVVDSQCDPMAAVRRSELEIAAAWLGRDGRVGTWWRLQQSSSDLSGLEGTGFS